MPFVLMKPALREGSSIYVIARAQNPSEGVPYSREDVAECGAVLDRNSDDVRDH
jgi:hypothetical protein